MENISNHEHGKEHAHESINDGKYYCSKHCKDDKTYFWQR
jgi:hypothetical protein